MQISSKAMNRMLLYFAIFLFACKDAVPPTPNLATIASEVVIVVPDTCADFNTVNTKIRDGVLVKKEALHLLQKYVPEIKEFYYKQGGREYPVSEWVFPVEGYDKVAIGGTNGSGYVASGYDYFDGNRHGGHPAHDIFIQDKDQNCVEDLRKKEVNILSMTGGIVVATENQWEADSPLRGGKYIWIYDPSVNSFFYYAHNDEIFVKPCDLVKPGDTIAHMGRTGLNAYKKRSPTHLHIMQLKLDSNFYPKPENCYKALTEAKRN
jgi:murein DD-endopeptidase MepM/ murein hydrolase activator NlpD